LLAPRLSFTQFCHSNLRCFLRPEFDGRWRSRKVLFYFWLLQSAKNPSKKYYSDLNGCHSRGVITFNADCDLFQFTMNFLREAGAIDLAGGHLLFEAGVKNQKLFERASFFDLASETRRSPKGLAPPPFCYFCGEAKVGPRQRKHQ
jgi:hypothetical protein